MSTTEFMDYDKEKGVIGPDPQEVEELSHPQRLIGKSRFRVLGFLRHTWRPFTVFTLLSSLGAACKPSDQEIHKSPPPIVASNNRETASDQLVIDKPTPSSVSETEQAPTEGKVYFKEYQAQPKANSSEQLIPEDVSKLITEALKTPPTAMKAFSPENPNVQINTALFTYFQTSEVEGKSFKEYVMFKDRQKYIIAGFKRVVTLDPKDQYHYEYRTTQGNQAFIDYKFFKHLSPQLEKDPTLAEMLVGDINRVEEAILVNPYTGKRFKYGQENSDDLSKFLAFFAPKTASAAELPTTPTDTATKAPEPTPTPKPQAGYEVKQDSVVYRTEKGEVLNVPHIPGLKAELKEADGQKKVVYLAEKDNKYRLKEGERAGSFHQNVSIAKEGVTSVMNPENNTKLVGGVELRSEVAGVLMEEALAKFEKQEDRYITPIPIDISGLKDQNQIILAETTASTEFGKYSFLAVQAPENLPTTNTFYVKSKGIWVLKSAGRDAGIRSLASRFLDTDKIEPGKEMFYLNTTVARKTPSSGFTLNNNAFGDRIVDENGQPIETTSYTVKIDFITPLSVKGKWNVALFLSALYDPRPMNLGHILTVKNPDGTSSPVFLSANN